MGWFKKNKDYKDRVFSNTEYRSEVKLDTTIERLRELAINGNTQAYESLKEHQLEIQRQRARIGQYK